MADSKRNAVFADFLKRQFPNSITILDVAAGKGELSRCLQNVYPNTNITAIDLKPRPLRGLRIRFIKGAFPQSVNIADYDLVVAMHPDGATWPLVQLCCQHRINFAVVPCCLVHVAPGFRGNMYDWVTYIRNYAERQGARVVATVLKMTGSNNVVVGKFY